MPNCDTDGAPSVTPMARAPSTTSAFSTMASTVRSDAGYTHALHRVLVHASLVGRVGLDAPMPVQVIRVHVQTDRRQRRDRVCRVQLEARQLNREHLGIGVDRARDRSTDIADLFDLDARAAQDLTEHTHGRGLAVRARHRQPRATRVRALLLETPGEFHLSPQVDTCLLAGTQTPGGARARPGTRRRGRGRPRRSRSRGRSDPPRTWTSTSATSSKNSDCPPRASNARTCQSRASSAPAAP